MQDQPATHHDAELILKLYDLRREETLRKARRWLIFEFKPKTLEDIFAIVQNADLAESAYYRQVISYWEMAASLVNFSSFATGSRKRPAGLLCGRRRNSLNATPPRERCSTRL